MESLFNLDPPDNSIFRLRTPYSKKIVNNDINIQSLKQANEISYSYLEKIVFPNSIKSSNKIGNVMVIEQETSSIIPVSGLPI